MREIKFRAWVKEGEMKMVCFTLDDCASQQLQDLLHGEVEARIMQFTGLKDKNGKEIYEGDVIRGRAHSLKSRIDIWEVTYSEGEASYGMKARNGIENRIAHYIVKGGQYEVIGNIYENPELLNETKE